MCMEKSSFQFTNPILTGLIFEIHKEFQAQGKINLGINIESNVQQEETSEHSVENKAHVSVVIVIGSKDNESPFYIEAREEANFKWNKDSFDEGQVETLLKQNAVSLLIAYLRPIISQITAASPYPTYNLPYIDLTSEE